MGPWRTAPFSHRSSDEQDVRVAIPRECMHYSFIDARVYVVQVLVGVQLVQLQVGSNSKREVGRRIIANIRIKSVSGTTVAEIRTFVSRSG